MDLGANILIVDDDKQIRRLVGRMLRKKGYLSTEASSAEEARKLLKKQKFELIVCDIVMPGESGLDFISFALSEYPHMAAVMMTGQDDPNFSEKAIKIGAYDYITKPFESDRLLSSVADFIGQRKTKAPKLARQDLMESEQKYRLLIKNIPGFVYRGYKDWSVDFIDNNVGELTGYDKQEFDARTLKWSDLVLEEDLSAAKKSVSGAMNTGNSYFREYRIKTKTGKILWMQDRGQIIRSETGKIEYLSGVFFDITEQKQAEEKLQQIEHQLVQSEKLSALGELTAGVSHELNQPLNGIKITSQSLLRDIKKNRLEEEELEDDLTEIVNQVNKMAEIIDHMRIYTRNTDGKSSERIDINTVIEGPFKLLDQQLKTHNIEVIRAFAPDLPKIACDPIRLEQVFMNLITNAKGSLDSCGKENKKIEIKAIARDDRQAVEVAVKDNGPGIPEHLRRKIFQPFFTTKEPGKGTGLGLSVSHKIIEEHQGRIELESKVGQGATFKVILPAGA